jgi:hypothetical protein
MSMKDRESSTIDYVMEQRREFDILYRDTPWRSVVSKGVQLDDEVLERFQREIFGWSHCLFSQNILLVELATSKSDNHRRARIARTRSSEYLSLGPVHCSFVQRYLDCLSS